MGASASISLANASLSAVDSSCAFTVLGWNGMKSAEEQGTSTDGVVRLSIQLARPLTVVWELKSASMGIMMSYFFRRNIVRDIILIESMPVL